MLQSWFPRGVETALVKYGSSEFQICVGDQILYNDFLDKASESSQRTVQQEIQARLPKGQLPASVGSMGPVRSSQRKRGRSSTHRPSRAVSKFRSVLVLVLCQY
eukprot:TRINITY_DN4358_c2_g1_i4.p1 TRINITY_DN4358_c2_g1~~TRINITY_DN4358_c2_g1_i4.p1  ORF type:complete len:104 (-),score=10.19 TRINITY_DN4358_c2_g1_i4:129-440(-)